MIAELNAIARMIQGEEHSFVPVKVASMEEAITQYEKSFAQTLKTVKEAADEDFEKPMAGVFAKFYPRRVDGILMFANDTIHHRGQLSVYIRLTGGKVPAIYGPSADENPFA